MATSRCSKATGHGERLLERRFVVSAGDECGKQDSGFEWVGVASWDQAAVDQVAL
ncbi:hypothetical protein [Nocardia sp. NPDC060259]|uniref:hypothetical protein n=1 Tax=Nocardia sp. NPDC060259 TaxID=3347088 RepID=UPI003668630D